jgi:hypothetical protein
MRVDVLELAGAGRLGLSDSDKIGVHFDEANELIFKRGTAVPWSDGEGAGRKPSDGLEPSTLSEPPPSTRGSEVGEAAQTGSGTFPDAGPAERR